MDKMVKSKNVLKLNEIDKKVLSTYSEGTTDQNKLRITPEACDK